MNTVRFILPSDKDEDACRQRQYACNNSRDGKSGDCREADHDQINGKQEHSDVLVKMKFIKSVFLLTCRATAHEASLYHPMAATLRQSGISMLPSRNLRLDQAAIRTLSLIESSIAASAVLLLPGC